MKRHLVFPQDFDTRAYHLEDEQDDWDENVKILHRRSRDQLVELLGQEFGSENLEGKAQDFKDMGVAPFSIISFHNQFFRQIRNSFVLGSYYPALTGACSLGERILNHMLLELRDHFRETPEYKKVYRKNSFDDWGAAIGTLESWGILSEKLSTEFKALGELRNRSLHFNHATYENVRADSLQAVRALSEIISLRFGFFRSEHEWGIDGSRGAQFIKKVYEEDPFIESFYLPRCPLVGPYYAVKYIDEGILFVDRAFYSSEEVTDEEFVQIFNNRNMDEVVCSDLPLADDIDPVGILLPSGNFQLPRKATFE